MPLRRIVPLLALGFALSATPALAQTLGTFRWQLQPYCSVVTVTVTQQGANYILEGTDDRCGGGEPVRQRHRHRLSDPTGPGRLRLDDCPARRDPGSYRSDDYDRVAQRDLA